MKKDKKEKVTYGGILILTSICFNVLAILKFIDNSTFTGILYLLIGSCFLCLSATAFRKAKDEGNKSDEDAENGKKDESGKDN